MMLRVILVACIIALVFGCAARKAQETQEAPWVGDKGFAPPPLQQPNAPAAKQSAGSPASSTAPTVPAPTTKPTGAAGSGKLVPLAEMSDSTPGAADVPHPPCQFQNCGVVLAIGTHQAAESLDQDDGGPGVYLPQGMYSAETAGQPEVVDSYGVQKIVRLWDVSVQMRDGTVQTIQQRNEPLFRVGDPVLVDGNNIVFW
jgi:hypothetical protein